MKWFSLPATLVALAIGSPANADLFSRLESVYRQDSDLNAPEVIAEPSGPILQPTPVPGGLHIKDNSAAGYPFTSGCYEPRSACCADLWHGYCGRRTCGSRLLSWFEHCADRCGPYRLNIPFWPPLQGCGSKVGVAGPAWHSCGPAPAPLWRFGQGTCEPSRLGLFDWLTIRGSCHGCGKGSYGAGCGCGTSQGTTHGGYETYQQGETIIAPHSVPAPTPVPAPAVTPTNSARRLFLPPHRIYQTDFEF